MKKDWKKFEELTEEIFNKLSKYPKIEKIERNIKINGLDGERQIDVLLTTQTAGLKLLTVVECKDYNSKLTVAAVDSLHSKLMDIRANKGILVSRKGFSSTAIAKAKRLGISLYTAHEALSDKWNIDVDIPIVICEITPIHFDGVFTIPPGSRHIGEKVSIYQDRMEVNGIDVGELLDRRWRDGSLDFQLTEKEQSIRFPELTTPYRVTFSRQTKQFFDVEDFHVSAKIRIKYFLGQLKELEDSQLIKDITGGRITFFMKAFPLQNYRETFRKISIEEVPNSKLIVSLTSIMQVDLKSNGGYIMRDSPD